MSTKTQARLREKLVDSRETQILQLFGNLGPKKKDDSKTLMAPFERIEAWPIGEDNRTRVRRIVMQAFSILRQDYYPSKDLTEAMRILVKKWPLTTVDVYLNNLFISMKLNSPGVKMLTSDPVLKGLFASHIFLPSLAKMPTPFNMVPLRSSRLVRYYMSTTVLLAYVVHRTLDIFPTQNEKEREQREREELNSHFFALVDRHLNANFYFFLSLIYLMMGTGFWKIYLPYPDPNDPMGQNIIQPPPEYIQVSHGLTKLTGILNYLVRGRGNVVDPDREKFVHIQSKENCETTGSPFKSHKINNVQYVHVNTGFSHQYAAMEHFIQAQANMQNCVAHFVIRDDKSVDLTVYDFQPMATNPSPISMTMRFAWLYNLWGVNGMIFHGPGQDLRESVLFAGTDPHHHFRLQNDSVYMENYLSQWLHQFLVEKIWLQMLDMPSMFAPYFFGPLPAAEVRPMERDFTIPSGSGKFACV